MNPALLTFIIQEAIAYGPQILTEIESLFKSGVPTVADLQALRNKLEAESYASFVPATKIPFNSPPPAPSAPVNITVLPDTAPDGSTTTPPPASGGSADPSAPFAAVVVAPLVATTDGAASGHTSPVAPA